MPGRHRRVGGEHGAGGDLFQRAVEVHARLTGHFAAAFQHLKGGVALVDVPHGRVQVQGTQCAHPADAQHDLLLDAGGDVAAVELVGDGPVRLLVLRQVGVEQVQGDVAGLGLPYLQHHPAAGQVDEHMQFLTVDQGRAQRQVLEPGRAVVGDLVAVGVDGLVEVALPVEHAHRYEGHAQIAGGLAVVTGQDAQAARIDGQGFVQAELGAEIGHQLVLFRVQVVPDLLARRLAVVAVIGRQGTDIVLHVDPVLGGGIQTFLGHPAQEQLGIVAALVPQLRVQPVEQAAHRSVPAVEQVVGQLLQTCQLPWQGGLDFDAIARSSHGGDQFLSLFKWYAPKWRTESPLR